MRRTLALWLLLFGVYAATLGLDAFAGSDYAGDEPHYLIATESLVEDGDLDVLDEYAQRAYADFYPHELEPHGRETEGRLNEPHGVGFPVLIAPAWALAGVKGVELFLAAIAALGMAVAYRSRCGWPRTRGRSAPRWPWGSARRSWPMAARCTRSWRPRPRLPAPRCWRSESTSGSVGATRSSASCCSAPCLGWGRSSCRRGS